MEISYKSFEFLRKVYSMNFTDHSEYEQENWNLIYFLSLKKNKNHFNIINIMV